MFYSSRFFFFFFDYVSEEGSTKSFTCARTLIGQYVFLQLVGSEGSLSLCEVEVFTTDGKSFFITTNFYNLITKILNGTLIDHH